MGSWFLSGLLEGSPPGCIDLDIEPLSWDLGSNRSHANTKSCIREYSAERREACSKAEAKRLRLQNFYSRQRETFEMYEFNPAFTCCERSLCGNKKGAAMRPGAASSPLESLAELEVPGPSLYSGSERRKKR